MTDWIKIDDPERPAPKDGTEIWSPIVAWNGYEVSSLGQVRSVDRSIVRRDGTVQAWRGRTLSRSVNSRGYLVVRLSDDANGRRVSARVHRLVASAFIPNPDNLPEVNHRDGDKTNPSIANLEWVTSHTNHLHARDAGLMPYARLGADAARQIRDRAAAGEGRRKLAREFGVSPKTVREVIARKTWAELPPPPQA